uniref:Uncharacterized protein n=1 Tax=Cyanoderma ruficeps TaxID=181631 RepID=A0A8C3P529_9PASS
LFPILSVLHLSLMLAIISVTFLLLFIYPSLSHFLLQTVPLLICLISLPVIPQMEKALLLQGRAVQTGSNHSVNVHDPVPEKLSCCQITESQNILNWSRPTTPTTLNWSRAQLLSEW